MKTIHSFMGMALCSFPVMAQQSPNFLIIQCDHLTQRVVGAYGADPSCTPPIDRIASQGVTFANAYVGCPLSQPSRAALWSGLMPHQTNVRSNSAEHINPPLPDSIPTLGSLFTANGYEAVHFGKTHDMGSLRGFRHKEPVAKPFTDPEFPVNNDSFLDVGTCEDAVAYLSNPPQEPFICIADFQNPHNICGYVGENKGEHIDSPISTPLPLLPGNFEVEDWEKLPLPIQYICCSHRRMMQAAHWNEDNYRHYVAAFQHYTNAGNHTLVVYLLTIFTSAQIQGVQTLLLVDPVRHLGEVCDGLDELDLAVVASLLVGNIKEVIHECAQEVALTELHHLDGCVLEDITVVAGAFQDLVIQSFHLSVSFYQIALPFTGGSLSCALLCLYFMLLYTNKSSASQQFFAGNGVVFIKTSELYKSARDFWAVFQLYTSAFSGILKAGMACLHGTGRSPTIRMFQTVMTIEKRSSDHESIYG